MSRAPARTALRNMAWLLGDKALAVLLGLLTFGLIGRAFGPAGAGHFAYATAMLQVTLGLALVCSGSALLPRFCRMHAALPGAIGNVFALRLGAAAIAVLLTAAYCVLMIDDAQRRNVTLLVLLAAPLIEPFYIIATYWLSLNRNRPTVIARSSGLIARTLLIAVGVWLGAPAWVLALGWLLEASINAGLQSLQLDRALPLARLRRHVRGSRICAYLGFGARFVTAAWLAQLFLRLDRLALAEAMDADSFGLYAVAMQLVEVWAQVAYLVGSALGPAYLYRAIRDGHPWRAYGRSALLMVALGLFGLGGAWLLGPWLLASVFGPRFEAAAPYLVAGAAFAVLFFADQVVQMVITARNRPLLLTLKWSASVTVAAATLWFGYARVGGYAGPLGLGLGLLAGWLVVLVASRGDALPPPPANRAAVRSAELER